MKLLFDQNLSPRLPAQLDALYPGSRHVRDFSLHESGDLPVWQHAELHGFVIVSKDDDFRILSERLGQPPKVVKLNFGNCPTTEIVAALRHYSAALHTFAARPDAAYLELQRP